MRIVKLCMFRNPGAEYVYRFIVVGRKKSMRAFISRSSKDDPITCFICNYAHLVVIHATRSQGDFYFKTTMCNEPREGFKSILEKLITDV